MQRPHEDLTGWSVVTSLAGCTVPSCVWLKVAAPRAIPCISYGDVVRHKPKVIVWVRRGVIRDTLWRQQRSLPLVAYRWSALRAVKGQRPCGCYARRLP